MMDKCFNEIEISHFRGFDYIKIANLTKLNVFVGSNNVGEKLDIGSCIHVIRHV